MMILSESLPAPVLDVDVVLLSRPWGKGEARVFLPLVHTSDYLGPFTAGCKTKEHIMYKCFQHLHISLVYELTEENC